MRPGLPFRPRRETGDNPGVHVGIADHLGWAVAVTAAADHGVAALVATVRASALQASSAARDDLAGALPAPVVSISLRFWPPDLPDDIDASPAVPHAVRLTRSGGRGDD
jgi:hypothetical protein